MYTCNNSFTSEAGTNYKTGDIISESEYLSLTFFDRTFFRKKASYSEGRLPDTIDTDVSMFRGDPEPIDFPEPPPGSEAFSAGGGGDGFDGGGASGSWSDNSPSDSGSSDSGGDGGGGE